MDRYTADRQGLARSPHLEFLRALFGEPASREVLPLDLQKILEQTDEAGWVLFLVDGYGVMNHEKLGGSRFSAWSKSELCAMWPTTTACFMTSFHTAMPSSTHGITGWWSYSDRDKSVVSPLNGRLLETGAPAQTIGYTPGRAIACKPVDRRGYEFDYRWFVPASFWLSPYMNFMHSSERGLSRVPYRNFKELSEALALRTQAGTKPPRWVVYLDDYDATSHRHGAGSREALLSIVRIELMIEALSTVLPAGTVKILSADHGMLDVPEKARFALEANHPLTQCLDVPPYGEPRQPLFRVQKGKEAEFNSLWMDAPWAGYFDLLTSDGLVDRGLLSRDYPRNSLADAHWNATIAVPKAPVVVQYTPKNNRPPRFIGYHGGPSPEESRIPVWHLEP